MGERRIATMTSKLTLSNTISNGPVGQPIPRVEGPAKVNGLCKYTADVDRPGILWGKTLRSPLPHARILNIDTLRPKVCLVLRPLLPRMMSVVGLWGQV